MKKAGLWIGMLCCGFALMTVWVAAQDMDSGETKPGKSSGATKSEKSTGETKTAKSSASKLSEGKTGDSKTAKTAKSAKSDSAKTDSAKTDSAKSDSAKKDSAPAGPRTVYLTFDDGPSELTPKVLDILKTNGIHATFFVCGNTSASGKELYKRIVAEGHTIGNHSFSHEPKNYKSPDLFVKDMEKLDDLVFKTTNVHTTVLRFPYGSNNNWGGKNDQGLNRMYDTAAAVRKAGYQYFDWNVNSLDYDAKLGGTKEDIVKNVTSQSKHVKKFAIVLMHDSKQHKNTVEALQEIIDNLKGMGFEFKALSTDSECYQMLKPKQVDVASASPAKTDASSKADPAPKQKKAEAN